MTVATEKNMLAEIASELKPSRRMSKAESSLQHGMTFNLATRRGYIHAEAMKVVASVKGLPYASVTRGAYVQGLVQLGILPVEFLKDPAIGWIKNVSAEEAAEMRKELERRISAAKSAGKLPDA